MMYERELELAKTAARKAGDYLNRCGTAHIDSADGRDIKISADKESERMIMEILSSTDYSVLSEEYGYKDKGSALRWIVDPLDGTMNYSRGLKELSCVSIALYKDNSPLLGVVYRYKTGEMFEGVAGEGAYMNGEKIRCSRISALSQAVLGTGFPVRRSYDDISLKAFIEEAKRFKKVRMLGSAAVMAVYVSCGQLDAYIEENVMLWDIAAAAVIVRAAGGECIMEETGDYKCTCKCFANEALKDEYDREIKI